MFNDRRARILALLGAVLGSLVFAWSCASGPRTGSVGADPSKVAGETEQSPVQKAGAVVASPAVDGAPRRGTPLFENHTLGTPKVWGSLAVFPIYSWAQEDIGDVVTLDEALEKNQAEVREVGPEGAAGELVDPHAGSARVNTLIVENKGDLPLLVLAGTILKGGKQDRQVGSDFLIGAHETKPVDAFCIEHGRWTTVRDGLATGGKFRVLKVLTEGEVRAAAHYEKDQGKVWEKVGKVNAAHGKSAPSDTLLATVDAADITAERDALAKEVRSFLRTTEDPANVVGFAYAVEGDVRGLRTFMTHHIFTKFEDTLTSTAAFEALSAEHEAKARGEKPKPGDVDASVIVAFVTAVDQAAPEVKASDDQIETSQKAEAGYGSKVELAPPATAPKGSKPKPVTRDYLRKKK